MTIAAIETQYAGCRFRSRLEARWAVFFDQLDIRWEYEPEGYELPSGRYLPDFLLRGIGGDAKMDGHDGSVWFEVKSIEANDFDQRWDELVVGTGIPLVAAFGIPRPDADLISCPNRSDGWMTTRWWYGEADTSIAWDNCRAFGFCPVHGEIGIAFEGLVERICEYDSNYHNWGNGHSWPDARVRHAYAHAWRARFEHGENGR